MDFSTGSDQNSPEVGLFPFPVFKNQTFQVFSQKVSRIWPISLDFQPEVVLFPPEVGLNQLIFQNFQGFTRFVAKSWWKWGPKMAKLLKKTEAEVDFSKFSRLHALCGKKFWKLATGNGNRVQKCLKTLVLWKNARFLAKSCEILPQETEMASKNA